MWLLFCPLGATVSGWRHGLSAPQHAAQLAGGTLRPPDHRERRGAHGDGAERPTQLEPAEAVFPTVLFVTASAQHFFIYCVTPNWLVSA